MRRAPLVVLDTNVVVSSQINPFGAPGRIWDLVTSRQLRLAYDDRVLAEYNEVLARPKFNFQADRIDALFAIFLFQESVTTSPWPHPSLPDPDDVMFLEVAKAAGCSLVTGNLKDFPKKLCDGVEVFSPDAWFKAYIGNAI